METRKPRRSSGRLVVMIVCQFGDGGEFGGVEKQAALLAGRLANRGEEIVFLSSTTSPGRANWREVRGQRVRFFWSYRNPQNVGRHLPAALIWAAQVGAWLFRHRRRIRVIHCHQIRIHSFVAALARKLWAVPVIQKSGLGGERADIRAVGTRKYFGRRGRRFLVRNSDIFIATTKSIREDLLSCDVEAEKIRLIPNGLVLPAPVAHEPPDGEVRMVFLGRLSSDKNLLALAEAAGRVCQPGRVILNIYGGGPQEEALKAILAGQTGGGVTFRGWTEDVSAVLRRHHYLMLPSELEGLSNAMIEAMAHGVAPVVSRVSGSVDHIEDGRTGFFLAGTDVDTLSKEILRVSQVDAGVWADISKRAMTWAQAQFDIEAVVDQYRELYERLDGR